METVQVMYSLAIGFGFGGLMFAITYHLFGVLQKILQRRQGLPTT